MDYQAIQQWLTEWAPRIALASIIMVAAYFVGKMVKWGITSAIDRLPFLSRRDTVAPGGEKPTVDVGERVGEVGYWVVLLVGVMAALNQFGTWAAPIVQPLNSMVQGFVDYVPEVVAAGLIFFIGFVLATIARRMVEAAAEAAEIDRRLIDAGLTHMPRGPGLARLLGILVFTLIIIPVSIQALATLNISAISDPATAMLRDILSTIPRVLGAALIILIAYVIGRWLAMLTEEGVKSIGFDDIISSIANAEPVRAGRDKMDMTPGVDTITFSKFPPSRMIGMAVLIGIVLFASVEAAQLLGFGAMAAMLSEVLGLATRVLFGAVIIALGILLANILAAAAGREGGPSSEIISTFIRWGVIALSTAVGLRFMGLANDIIVLAFGLVLGAVAVAVAIAFGIGGREAAKRLLDRWTAGS
jgi:hypothetical protein